MVSLAHSSVTSLASFSTSDTKLFFSNKQSNGNLFSFIIGVVPWAIHDSGMIKHIELFLNKPSS